LLTARLPCGTGATRYRCFLPDLTEFTVPPCTGPNYQQSTSSVRHGGEGGIRTPGTLIRGTHDFQSCTFNRSVTSPVSNPSMRSIAGECLEATIAPSDFLQIGEISRLQRTVVLPGNFLSAVLNHLTFFNRLLFSSQIGSKYLFKMKNLKTRDRLI
jgi:hypothetical protein